MLHCTRVLLVGKVGAGSEGASMNEGSYDALLMPYIFAEPRLNGS